MTTKRSGDGHHCHAINCQTACKPEYLMCPRHWRMVPMRMQAAVYAAYRRGQCDDMNPSQAWVTAAKAAIRYVAEKDGVNVAQIERDEADWSAFARTCPQ